MPKQELDKYKTSRYTKETGKKPTMPQPCTKNYRQLRNTKIGKNSPSQGRAHQLNIQNQTLSQENKYISNSIGNE